MVKDANCEVLRLAAWFVVMAMTWSVDSAAICAVKKLSNCAELSVAKSLVSKPANCEVVNEAIWVVANLEACMVVNAATWSVVKAAIFVLLS